MFREKELIYLSISSKIIDFEEKKKQKSIIFNRIRLNEIYFSTVFSRSFDQLLIDFFINLAAFLMDLRPDFRLIFKKSIGNKFQKSI